MILMPCVLTAHQEHTIFIKEMVLIRLSLYWDSKEGIILEIKTSLQLYNLHIKKVLQKMEALRLMIQLQTTQDLGFIVHKKYKIQHSMIGVR
jgi:hypothetical protein